MTSARSKKKKKKKKLYRMNILNSRSDSSITSTTICRFEYFNESKRKKKKKKIFAHLQRTHRSNRRKPSLFRIESRVHSNLPKNQTSDSDQSIKEKKSATNNF